MKISARGVVLAAAFVAGGLGVGVAWSQDAMQVVTARQETMKRISKDFAAVKAFIDDKGDLAAARAGGTDLAVAANTIPSLFPKDTGMAQFPGKSGAKPAIWAEWDKFQAAHKTAVAKIDDLNNALKGGDKVAISAAFGEAGKNGCGGCHTPYREKLS